VGALVVQQLTQLVVGQAPDPALQASVREVVLVRYGKFAASWANLFRHRDLGSSSGTCSGPAACAATS
jgi:hypothetical protein